MRATILSWLAAFILIFGLNGLFHTFVAAGLYDPYLHGLMLPMAQANPGFVAGVDAVLVVVMASSCEQAHSRYRSSRVPNPASQLGWLLPGRITLSTVR